MRPVVKNDERQKVVDAYKQTFKTPAGKLVLDDLKQSFGKNTFHTDTNQSFYNQGQRSIIDLILQTIED